MEKQLVVFELGNEQYGVDIGIVESIIKMAQITAIPHAPEFVEGVTNLRGVVLPVVDLRKRFGLPQIKVTKNTRIIVVEVDNAVVGMIVDAVVEVMRVSVEDVEPPSPLITTVNSTFIAGIAKTAGQLIILLNLNQVLSAREQAMLQAMPVLA